jgi:tripartite-type tricarboxylate transporter receptor subunit TctC
VKPKVKSIMPAACALASLVAALALGAAAQLASAQGQNTYPLRPVRFVVPYPPGGSTDPTARLIGTHLTTIWGQQVVVENRAGGDTIIGSSVVAHAPADGHTILYAATTHVIIPLLHKNMPFDAMRDLLPVATVASNEKLLVLHPSVPAHNLQELIAYAKAHPGKLNFAMTANGSANHLASEMLNIQAGMRTLMVPYKGAGPALTDLMGGHVQMLFALPVSVIQHVQRGAVRGIAMSGNARLAALPQIPTFAEAGMPKLEVSTWQGILAPARVPRAIVHKISKDVAQILAGREVQDKLNAQGSVPLVSTPEQFATLMRAEQARYARVIEAANIRL